MKTEYSALFLVANVLSMTVVVQINFIQSADAVKSQGTKSMKYGIETKNKVCGDRLCTPEDFTSMSERKPLPALSDSISSQMAMVKMERLFELHRVQLMSAWDLMTDSEKSHMMKMFDGMYEKMQSMSFTDHMKHMSKMMGEKHHESTDYPHDMKDKHGMKDCSCGNGEHGCSCGEHPMTCESGDKGCTCSEDGVCNCGKGCICASCH